MQGAVRALASHTASKRLDTWVGVMVKKLMAHNGPRSKHESALHTVLVGRLHLCSGDDTNADMKAMVLLCLKHRVYTSYCS
jgi:hypothetical protein